MKHIGRRRNIWGPWDYSGLLCACTAGDRAMHRHSKAHTNAHQAIVENTRYLLS